MEAATVTFGFDTAVDFATECIDRLHSTAESHQRILVIEVMGRYAGWIALNSGVAASADVRALGEGRSGIMVALDPPTVKYVPLAACISRMKTVPVDCDTMLAARGLGISFGD